MLLKHIRKIHSGIKVHIKTDLAINVFAVNSLNKSAFAAGVDRDGLFAPILTSLKSCLLYLFIF